MNRKLAIFDLDGTLVDTVTDVAACFDEALVSCGHPARGVDGVSRLLGRPLEVIVAGLLPEDAAADADEVTKVAQAYRAAYKASDKPNTKPFPGIVELCRSLIDSGMTVAVNTNKPHENAVAVVESFFGNLPMRVCGYGAVDTVKPDPAGANLLMKQAGATPEETVYVGDTIIDVQTAEAAGLDCIVVTWGQGTDDLYEDERVFSVAHTADELAALIGEAR